MKPSFFFFYFGPASGPTAVSLRSPEPDRRYCVPEDAARGEYRTGHGAGREVITKKKNSGQIRTWGPHEIALEVAFLGEKSILGWVYCFRCRYKGAILFFTRAG